MRPDFSGSRIDRRDYFQGHRRSGHICDSSLTACPLHLTAPWHRLQPVSFWSAACAPGRSLNLGLGFSWVPHMPPLHVGSSITPSSQLAAGAPSSVFGSWGFCRFSNFLLATHSHYSDSPARFCRQWNTASRTRPMVSFAHSLAFADPASKISTTCLGCCS